MCHSAEYNLFGCVCPLLRIGTPHPLSRKRVCPLGTEGGTYSSAGGGWWRGPNSDDWRKSLALCLLWVFASPKKVGGQCTVLV